MEIYIGWSLNYFEEYIIKQTIIAIKFSRVKSNRLPIKNANYNLPQLRIEPRSSNMPDKRSNDCATQLVPICITSLYHIPKISHRLSIHTGMAVS